MTAQVRARGALRPARAQSARAVGAAAIARSILTVAILAQWAAALLAGPSAQAEPLGVQPSVGVSAEYDSNPYILASRAIAAESGAVNVDLPTTYNGDEQTFQLEPRFRYAQSAGVVALLSNYEDIDGLWKLALERTVFSVTGSWYHDSTYYNQFENAALSGRTVNRTEQKGGLDWRWLLTERDDLDVSGSFDKVGYGANSAGILENFEYSQAQARFDRSLSELWQWSFIAGYGYYELPDSDYRSADDFVETSIQRTLSERWSLTAQLGYTYLRADTRVPELYCCTISPSGYLELYEHSVIDDSSGDTPNYAVTLERRYQRLTLDLSASRAVQPSGFGALLAETDLSLHAGYQLSERWRVGAALHSLQQSDTLGRLNLGNGRYYDLDLSAGWKWTARWTLRLNTSFDLQRINRQQAHRANVLLSLTRQFGRFGL